MPIELESKIEGLLFYKNEEISFSKLAEILSTDIEEIKQAVEKLEQSLSNRGIVLIKNGDSVLLGVHNELSSLVESIRKGEVNKALSKAALETLSIVMYKSGISRSEIDYIRGVNSSFILRNLLVRGLIERNTDENKKNGYKPSFDALAFMGVTSIEKLPNYESIREQLQNTINQNTANE